MTAEATILSISIWFVLSYILLYLSIKLIRKTELSIILMSLWVISFAAISIYPITNTPDYKQYKENECHLKFGGVMSWSNQCVVPAIKPADYNRWDDIFVGGFDYITWVVVYIQEPK